MSNYKFPIPKRWSGRLFLSGIILAILFCVADLWLPGTGTKAYQYDKQGKLSRRVLPGGKGIRYEYDKAGLLVGRSAHRVGSLTGWAYPGGDRVKFAYDLAGNRVAMEDGRGKSQYVYDTENRLQEVIAPDGKRIRYDFDSWGNIRHLTLPGDLRLEYRRDALGKLTKLSDGQEPIVRYEYDAHQQQVRRRFSNGVSTSYEYAPTGLPLAISHHKADGTLIVAFRYEYDSDRRLIRAEEITPEKTSVTRYEYDLAGRLAKVLPSEGAAVGYAYDLMGNRTAKTEGNETVHYKYDPKGKLVEAGAARLAYDAAGNLISKQSGAARTDYEYDDENRLLEVRQKQDVVRYFYDGDGNLVRREHNGKSISYLHDPLAGIAQIAAEYDENGQGSHYLLGNSRVGKRGTNGPEFYLEDLLGSTRLVVDAEGNVKARYAYSPFGEPLAAEGKPQPEFLYSGELWDAETRLLFLRSRFYDPALGRFLSPDPIQGSPLRPETFNQYVYANNDPLNQMDPLGLQSIWRLPPPPPPPPFGGASQRWWETGIPYGLPLDWQKQKQPNEQFNFGRELWDMTRRGEWFHANTPIQHDLRAALVGLSFIPGLGKIPSWVLFTNDRLYELNHDQMGKFLFGVGKKGVSMLDKRLGYAAKLHSLADELRQGAIVPWVTREAQRAIPPLLTEMRRTFFPQQSRNPLDSLSTFDPFLARSLEQQRNIFIPPPPGGGGSFPLVGGVYLDQTARMIGELGTITGASYDARSGRLILIGDKQTKLPPMKPEYLAAALRAVYADSPHEPGVSIDPNPQNPYSATMFVKFFGNTENTRLGWVMFEADRVMKGYSVGTDNLTRQPVQSAIPGYQSVAAMAFQAEARTGPQVWSRFWLVPEPVTARVSEDGSTVLFDSVKMRVKTQTMKWAGDKLVPAGETKDPQAEAFAAHFTAHYEDFAQENPIYAELKQVACAVALAKWMRQRQVPVDWNFVRTFAGATYQTPDQTPAAFAEQTQRVERGTSVLIRKLAVFGGVEMAPQLQMQRQTELTQLQSQLDKQWVAAKQQGKQSAQLDFDSKTYQLAALPSAEKRELASFSLSEMDATGLGEAESAGLLGLTRYYNSLHNEATEYGFSWSLLLPRLEFEAVAEKGNTQYLSVGGDVNKRVRAQRFLLADSFGLCHERFVKPFADEAFNRIGFAPAQESSIYRGIYPEADGTYRLIFADQHQAIFDASGKLHAVLAPASKALYDYDAHHRLVSLRFSSAGQNGQVNFEYDSRGRLSACVSGERRTTYKYDEAGNLAQVKTSDGETEYRYNERRLLTEVIVNGKTTVQNAYDETGHLTEQRDAYGDLTEQHIAATPDGQVVTIKQGANFVRQRYDAHLRLIGLEQSDGSTQQYRYNDAGRLIGTHSVLPNGGQLRMEASSDGKTLVMHDPRLVRREYRFGSNGQLAEVLMDNKSAATYRYDADDKLTEIRYQNGAAEQFAYDAQGRLSFYRRVLPDSEPEPGDTLAFAYDEQGQWIGFGAATAETTIDASAQRYNDTPAANAEMSTQDGATRTFLLRNSSGGQTKYTFTTAGLLLMVENPYGAKTSYTYDEHHRLQHITHPDGRRLVFRYDATTGKVSEERSE